MQKATTFSGHIVQGEIMLDDKQAFARMVKLLEGKRVSLQLGKQVNKRSNPQNAYYWGCVLKTLGDHLGYTSDELHDVMKFKFLCVDRDAEVPRFRSTTSLSTLEFNEYLERIAQFAAELGCYIPEPNEVAA